MRRNWIPPPAHEEYIITVNSALKAIMAFIQLLYCFIYLFIFLKMFHKYM